MPPSTEGLLTRLLAGVERELPDAIALRHRLHSHPELAHAEEQTAATVAEELPVACATVAGTGRMASVGPAGRAAVAVRAELDGLPVRERTDAPFRATGGAMHACGHDVHMAALVALTRAAHALGEELPAPLVAVFQPSEEAYPSGAEQLAREELAALAPAAVVGVHVHPELPWGTVALDPGVVNASSDSVEITVEGEPSHGAYPHHGRDPILALAQIVVALHAQVARRIDPHGPAVLAVGVLEGGSTENVIPSHARARASLRAHRPADRLALRALVEEVVGGSRGRPRLPWHRGARAGRARARERPTHRRPRPRAAGGRRSRPRPRVALVRLGRLRVLRRPFPDRDGVRRARRRRGLHLKAAPPPRAAPARQRRRGRRARPGPALRGRRCRGAGGVAVESVSRQGGRSRGWCRQTSAKDMRSRINTPISTQPAHAQPARNGSTAARRASVRVLLALLPAVLMLAIAQPAAAAVPTATTEKASAITQTTATLNAMVNPNGAETNCEFEYGPTTSYGSKAPCSTPLPGAGLVPVPVSASVTGLTANTIYHFRIVATNASGPSLAAGDEMLTTLPNAPIVETNAASATNQTTATFNAMVNPNGAETNCEFEYGPTTSYGSKAPCSIPLPGAGLVPVPVSASVTGLTANTTYHFRISATNAGGTSQGGDAALTTLPNAPTVEAKAASAITLTTATLNAMANPNGGEVSKCEFEYGTTNTYGKVAQCSSLPGSGTSPVSVSASITGLDRRTRPTTSGSSATNAGGTSKGSDETLKTLANVVPPSETPGPPPRGPVLPLPPVSTGLPGPVLARTANVATIAGRVLVRLPGTRGFVALSSAGLQIPYRTVVEASHGEVIITAATARGGTQTAEFFDGRFQLTQGSNGMVVATLAGGDFSVCPPRGRASRQHLVRRLWGVANGSFSTKGISASVVVQGAQWLTEDMCEGTLVLTTQGRVAVTDLVRHRRVRVSAGRVFLARTR